MVSRWQYHSTAFLADALVDCALASQDREYYSLTFWKTRRDGNISEWFWVDAIFDILDVMESR